MRTVTVSHNWYSFLWCSGTAVLTVFGVPPNISCWDWGRMCRAWLGLVGMKSELGHSLTATTLPIGMVKNAAKMGDMQDPCGRPVLVGHRLSHFPSKETVVYQS